MNRICFGLCLCLCLHSYFFLADAVQGKATAIAHERLHGNLRTACPSAGATLNIHLSRTAPSASTSPVVFGTLVEPSCDDTGEDFDRGYALAVNCTGEACTAEVKGLHPGRWIHRLLATNAAGSVQLQARATTLLDRSAGTHRIRWPLFGSVFTVTSLADFPGCSGCLRHALSVVTAAEKPALIQFAAQIAGTIVLTAGLPALSGSMVTVDALDLDARPHTRIIDGNGLNAVGLRITGADNEIIGLRVENVGSNEDSILIDGPNAHRNVLDQVSILGRARLTCGDNFEGCIIDGMCRTQATDPPFGACGDDGVAVRNGAGAIGENVIRRCTIQGAFDKAVKSSDGGVVRVERCYISENRDGGIQATIGGSVVAVENVIELNRGTNSASGLAANGAASSLRTRGNISRTNALRGISVRGSSSVELRDDYLCGNGTGGRGAGFGLTVFDSGAEPAFALVRGAAMVHNMDGGVLVSGTSVADLGTAADPGRNALAFNGPSTANVRRQLRTTTTQPLFAAGNQWEHCEREWRCREATVRAMDVEIAPGASSVSLSPVVATLRRRPPRITSMQPPFAAAGDLVWIYGEGFDAVDGNGPAAFCDTIAASNTCWPLRGNCVLFGGQAADVVAVTPTMLVVRAPFTCVEPIVVFVRTRFSLGYARFPFCTYPDG